jgi:hypothetical protein
MRNAATGLAVLLVCVCAPLSFAQQKPAAPPPTPAGTIAGALTSADLGQPVRKAQVRLITPASRTPRATTTNGDGRYVFTGVPPGDYTLSASRPGYLEMTYGARRPGPGAQGTIVTLAGGQTVENISWTLPRAGVVTGTVLDEFGDPAFNVPVRAMRFLFQNGHRAITHGGNGVTDDRGVYRIAGLLPGEYLVAAVPRDNVADAGLRAESLRVRIADLNAAAKKAGRPSNTVPPPEMPDPLGYVPTYFPGTPHGASAATVRVGVSEEVAGIDIRLELVRTVTVSGRIVSTEAVIPQSRLQLIDASLPLSLVGIWFRDMRPDGSFSFPGVLPGTYIVKAHGTPGGPKGVAGGTMWGRVNLSVDDRGTSDVGVTMQRGVTVSGRVALDTLPAGLDRSRLRLRLSPVSGPTDWEMPVLPLAIDDTGAFAVLNVLPGTFRIRAHGLPDGWWVETAPFGNRDAADHHVVVDGSGPLTGQVRFTSKMGELAGSVSNVDGSPAPHHTVIAFPADSALWLPYSRRIQVTQPGPDGRYTMRGLAPGSYRVATILDHEPGREFDPELLRTLASTAATVAIDAGGTSRLDLRVR